MEIALWKTTRSPNPFQMNRMADWGQFPDSRLLNSGGKRTQKGKGTKNRVHLMDVYNFFVRLNCTHEIQEFFPSYKGFFSAHVLMIRAFYLCYYTSFRSFKNHFWVLISEHFVHLQRTKKREGLRV